ncbi:EAL domain-containing protein [Actinoplanes sp. CA-252034]|uniref:putative bifunctional diguanylate cyclase/phosphodiesterase n=1 Tax=Actinoplanes sp. CA-252034 TaxID=3239906 RepID=UPI003D9771B7
MRVPGWLAWLMCGLGATVAYTAMPYGWASLAVSTVISAGSCAIMVAGIRRNRPAAPGNWYLFAAAVATWILGDIVYAVQILVDGEPAFPSWADALYLGAYPMLTVALFRLTRERLAGGGYLRGNLIDSAIIGVGVGIVYWTFMIEPIVTDSSVPVLTRVATAGYPTVGVLLCAVVTPILLRRGPRSPSLWLLTAGSAITLAGNISYTLLPHAVEPVYLYAGYLTAYACWAAAAAHPSMARPVTGDRDGLGRSRLLVLTASTLLVPAVLLVQGEHGGGRVSWAAVAVGSMALFVLVATRMSGYISRVDSQARQLRDLAMRDDLTGLPNRRDFEQRAAHAVAAAPCHMIMIDLAGFKHVNDRLGRAAGDQALIAVADLLRLSIRDGDVVARMGADEFAVLVHDTLPDDGQAVAGRLTEVLRHPIHAGEHELLLNARLGVASSTLPGSSLTSTPSGVASSGVASSGVASSGVASSGVASSGVAASGVAASGKAASSGVASSLAASSGVASPAVSGVALDGAAELIRRADTARYAAKASGGQLVEYTPELDERAEAAERLGADLRHSLDDGDFQVVYQPIIDLRDDRPVAVEALVRWTHPVRGPVSPVAFIPVAEDNGLIVELGEWIMRTACRQLAAWRSALGAEAPLYISVNVSPRQLSEPGFPAVVLGILADTGLEPAALLVEVTETAIFGGGTAIEAVETLHRAGIRIALDDFGTGHSSLGLLRTVPVDVLKIDKSFVDEILEPGRRAVIVDALIHVCTGLDLRAVAEGVETAEQADYLRELGYHYAQGYHFGRPAPDPITPVADTLTV